MNRREFVSKLGIAALAGGSVAACTQEKAAQVQQKLADEPVRNWKMVTSWPKNYPLLGTGAEQLAQRIGALSNGKLNVKVYAAGELVPAFECFDVVSQGAVQMSHSGSYYWQGKNPAMQFFTAVPFGMNAVQMIAWLYEGDGLKLWEELCAPFGVIPLPAGNTEMQMGGWFNREINQPSDLHGLKIRTPGIGGEVLRRVGATPVTLPGGELLTAMETGVLDAAEWIGPYADSVLGLHKVAKYYYYPGWQEPTVSLECLINREAFEELPDYLREIVRAAVRTQASMLMPECLIRNMRTLPEILNSDVELRRFPDEVLEQLRQASAEVMRTVAASSELAGRIYQSYQKFQRESSKWLSVSEKVIYDLTVR